MKQLFLLLGFGWQLIACAQKATSVIDAAEVLRIENVLASDAMQGRRTGSPQLDSAARFIRAEFMSAGLEPMGKDFVQEFALIRPRFIAVKAQMDGRVLDPRNVIVVTTTPNLEVNEKMGYRIQYFTSKNIADAVQLSRAARAAISAKENTVIFIDTVFAQQFSRLTSLKRQLFQSDHSVIFVLGNQQPRAYTITAEHSIDSTILKNVVGMLPGKSRKNEYVIFSAHYDHIGIGKPVAGDSIYNGANDDAAGTTAVMMLARHFKKLANNERTLVFVAFTAEETGGFGGQYFSRSLDPARIAAMFNIEMIGTHSKWGPNSAFITGFDKSTLGSILQTALKNSGFTFYPDPYPDQQLFYRSDNATLALLGVPAHTISTAKMDNEPFYHQPGDEVKTLDIENMSAIINAIAVSATTIISGKDTPTRVAIEK